MRETNRLSHETSRVSWTDEEKAANKEYQSEYRASLTEEEKASNKEADKETSKKSDGIIFSQAGFSKFNAHRKSFESKASCN